MGVRGEGKLFERLHPLIANSHSIRKIRKVRFKYEKLNYEGKSKYDEGNGFCLRHPDRQKWVRND
jgi:hypothetical protein